MEKNNPLTNIFNQFKNNKMLMILAVAGIGLLLLSRIFTLGDNAPAQTSGTPKVEALESFEVQIQKELESILGKMSGVGKVNVMVTLENGPETIYSQNYTENNRESNEQDSQGGTRTTVDYNRTGQLVIARSGGSEAPVVVKEIMPKVRGVLVVCENGANPKVRLAVTKAIQSVLDVPAYKISVVEGK